ncbi:hypothetical protein DPMN_145246 [Dreissena polymorpha]|uniref:Uncharacterized protein n=1 Tax=Dreissena polymorpha TaxID=45954 RepID=A0A9D4F804_DREPO|nr:hypothetical protein DPMN_145246 [Dreissena polymorpha]
MAKKRTKHTVTHLTSKNQSLYTSALVTKHLRTSGPELALFNPSSENTTRPELQRPHDPTTP